MENKAYKITTLDGDYVGQVLVPNEIRHVARYLQEGSSNKQGLYGKATTDIDGLKYDFEYDEELIIEEKQGTAFEKFFQDKNRQYKVLERKYLKHGDVSVAVIKKEEFKVREVIIFFSSGKYAHLKVREAEGIPHEQTIRTIMSLWKYELMEEKKLELLPFQETLKEANRKHELEVIEHNGSFKIAYSI